MRQIQQLVCNLTIDNIKKTGEEETREKNAIFTGNKLKQPTNQQILRISYQNFSAL